MGGKSSTADQQIARIATGAWGIVERGELLAVGVTARMIERRVARGVLIPEYRRVWRVGHRAPSQESDYMAATKAAGAGTYISGPPAAHALGLVKGKAPPPEVTSIRRLDIRGLKSTSCRRLAREDTSKWKGIPITSPARTLVDLASRMSADALARACHEAGVKHRTTPAHVEAALTRRPNAKGAAKLRAIIAGDQKVLLSKLERGFLRRVQRLQRPLPITNKPAGSRRVDCRWPDHKFTVELNSYRFHNSRHAWEGDYRREREARSRGDEFRRFTWRDVFEDPSYLEAEICALLPALSRSS